MTKSKHTQPPVSDTKVHDGVQRNVGKFKEQGYIQSGYVEILIRHLSVIKLDQDVRMVYYCTASGFNELVWFTNFGLTSVNTLICGTFPT